MKRLKVTFVLPSLHGGGAERAAVVLLNGLPQNEYDAGLYLFAEHGAYIDQVAPHVRVSVGRQGRVARVRALREFIAGEHIDLVVSFLSHFTAYAAARTSGGHVRYVISQQTPVSGFLADADYHWRRPINRRLFELVARTVYPRVDLIAATSQGVADDLMANYGVRPEQIAIVHNPVDVAAVECRSSESIAEDLSDGPLPTIVTAGRLADAKNLPLLVASLTVLQARFPFRAWILGQGELEPELRRLLAAADLQDRVRLLGFQENPWKYLARADVFVLTSRYEGFGNVLIEAMACGLPVVATASSGTREIVEHGQSGFLVEHTPAAVASALERVVTEPGLRERMSAAARARARDFATSTIVQRFSAALRSAATSAVQ